jgi:gamma-carbonic anhydrase
VFRRVGSRGSAEQREALVTLTRPEGESPSGNRVRLEGMVNVHPEAWVSPHAVLRGDVTIGAGSRILDLAVIHAVQGPVTIGADVVVMEHALLRGRADHPVLVGDSVLVGPHTHLNGTHVENEVFVATGVSMFPGSRAGAAAELRINSVLHVNSRLAPGTVLPIGWVAAGDPAELFSPDRHEDLWAVQEPLDFPGTVYGADRGTSMREIMRRQSRHFGPD